MTDMIAAFVDQYLEGDLFALNVFKDWCEENSGEFKVSQSPVRSPEELVLSYAARGASQEILWDIERSPLILALRLYFHWGFPIFLEDYHVIRRSVWLAYNGQPWFVYDGVLDENDLGMLHKLEIGKVYTQLCYPEYPRMFSFEGDEFSISLMGEYVFYRDGDWFTTVFKEKPYLISRDLEVLPVQPGWEFPSYHGGWDTYYWDGERWNIR